MGGYMGFGMSSWIYKQGPRKAFSKRKRRPTCNTLSTYDRAFKLQPSKKSSNLYIVFSILCIGLVAVGLHYRIPEFTKYNSIRNVQKRERIKLKKKGTFNFLMHSGQNRLRANNLVGAHSEFKLAKAIYPKDELVNQLLVETLVALCEDNNTYCDELHVILENSL
ncbi:hypothetical protein [Psychroserpens damuponensis]|uniref:hypothetical protein n=1 Tax=Psychroserpens damuponensis TaxID=943936 RepID=UPI00058ED7DB|nr:hypothetical protein [Psychroserpens damuponensis]